MRSVNIRYVPAVDHLRAFAALLILFYHGVGVIEYFLRFGQTFQFGSPIAFSFPPFALIIEGHTAVALFMVLSGFILTYGALNREVNYPQFIRNRFLRTYPLFLFIVFAGLAAFPEHFSLPAFVQTVFGFANVPGALDLGGFSSLLWTVSVEWQFYLLFPFLLLIMRQGWTRHLIGFIGLMLVFRALAVMAGGNPRDLSYTTIVGRLDQFLLGMWAAWYFSKQTLSRPAAIALTLGSGAAALAMLFAFNRAGSWLLVTPWKIAWPTLEGAVWTAFIVGYVSSIGRGTARWSRVLSGIGAISYSMYLVHFIVLTSMVKYGWLLRWTGNTVTDALLSVLLVGLPVTLAVSAWTYHFVELPFLRLRGPYYRDQAAAEA